MNINKTESDGNSLEGSFFKHATLNRSNNPNGLGIHTESRRPSKLVQNPYSLKTLCKKDFLWSLSFQRVGVFVLLWIEPNGVYAVP
ncbi:hypothetical protein evm_002586 [Chilo suppressalis]|nr:hypothetical protein evm_002586 [Chilo suppressalis]